MKVLIIARATLYDSPGGDTIQIIRTAEALRDIGISVDIGITNARFDYTLYDIIHFFNIIRPADILFHFDKAPKKVISSIFVDYHEAEQMAGNKIRILLSKIFGSFGVEYLKTIAKALLGKEKIQSYKYIWYGQYRSIKYLYRNADAILPNSISEQKRLEKAFGNTPAKVSRVVNAVSINNNINSNEKYANAIICVARIERLKNQYLLIQALNQINIPSFIIGKPAINDFEYYEKCKAICKPHVSFIENLPQEEIFAIMKAARVHVLPSWFETTGLSSLEAAYYGCNIVISDRGDQKEYFRNFAYYCDPNNVDSIKKAIENAYNAPYSTDFKKIISEQYTWQQTALQTKKIYLDILYPKFNF